MWYKRDFLENVSLFQSLPIRILKGPRQVGKTSLLLRLSGYQTVYFDDLQVRQAVQLNPRLFLQQFSGPLILDEASLAPEIFPELKRQVDEARRLGQPPPEVWITGSNQTLLQKNVRESLAGRASYFDLNTLSLHELRQPEEGDSSEISLRLILMRGGWPELHARRDLDPVRYLNGLISTFVEKDIVAAAGIERQEAFSRSLGLVAGRVGQLLNASDIASVVGVDTTTIQSWYALLEQNGLIRRLRAFASNLNQRLIKTPKIYFKDVGMAVRLQGWTEFLPLMSSLQFGHLVENLAVSEVSRAFSNRGLPASLHYVRSKEKVEVDLLIELPNQRYIAAEVKTMPQPWTLKQHELIDGLALQVVEKWVLVPERTAVVHSLAGVRLLEFGEIWDALGQYLD